MIKSQHYTISPTEGLRKITALIMLFIVLSATLSHTSHFDISFSQNEHAQCHLCQSNIDSPEVAVQIQAIYLRAIYLSIATSSERIFHWQSFVFPSLRAPPQL